MVYTAEQTRAARILSLTDVYYRNMWQEHRELGYATKGGSKYEINIANDFPDKEGTQVALMHEIGHLYYGHCDKTDLVKEFKDIERICKENNRSFKRVMRSYSGPHNFVNIAMDMQINSTLLTRKNIRTLVDAGFTPCTPELYNIEIPDDELNFRSYYLPLILKVMEEQPENETSTSGTDEAAGDSIPEADVMQDLPESISAFDDEEDLSDDILDSIMDEEYSSGSEKGLEDNVALRTTVGREMGLTVIGDGTDSDLSLSVQELSDKVIKKFLLSILGKTAGMVPNVIKSHNRGTRNDGSGILHTMPKRVKAVHKKKLGILVDVSGSMGHEDLIKAISTIRETAPNLDPSSVVVTWNRKLVEEWTIMDMPQSFRTNGGTDLAEGITYLDEKGCEEIIIYSDLFTNMSSLIHAAEQSKANVNTIWLTCLDDDKITDKDLIRYIKANEKMIRVK